MGFEPSTLFGGTLFPRISTSRQRTSKSSIWIVTRQVALVVKNLSAKGEDIRDVGLIAGAVRFLEGRAWQPTPAFSTAWRIPWGRQACQGAIHRVAQNWTQLR